MEKPWEDEPNYEEGTTAVGLPYNIVRQNTMKHLCGYVGVPKSHPLYGVDYMDSHPSLEAMMTAKDGNSLEQEINSNPMTTLLGMLDGWPASPIHAFEVHGTVTYSGWGDQEEGSDYWYFGFDCAHLHDLVPGYFDSDSHIAPLAPQLFADSVYRDIDYVRRQCEQLAMQLIQVE